MSPVQAVMRRWWAFQHISLPEGYVETHRVRGFVIDNVTYPGHPRIIFGSVEEPISHERCSNPLVPNPFGVYEGLANIRHFFPGENKFTFLPDSRKLFFNGSWFNPVPMLSWRVHAHEHERVEKLQQSLQQEGHHPQAEMLAEMRRLGTIIMVSQLNRRWIQLYGLGITPTDAHHYEAICYGPPKSD